MKIYGLLFLLLVICIPGIADDAAITVADVDFAQQLIHDSGTALLLNGAGVRRKWFFNVYAAGLYLPKRSTRVDEILAMPGPKQIRMHFLMNVSQKKLLATLDEGLAANNSAEQLVALKDDVTALKALFKTVRKHDVVIIDYLPSVGTRVWMNDVLQGVIAGVALQQAVLRVWLGEKPADEQLKKHFLGFH